MSSGDTIGLATAVVVANIDPMDQGRVSVQFAGRSNAMWSPVAVPTGAAAASIPIGSRVLVGFENGDGDHPFVLGTVQAAAGVAAALPATSGLTTASGLSVVLDDGAQTLTLATPAGLAVTLSDVVGAIRIADASGNLVVFDHGGVAVTSAGTVTVTAATVHVATRALQVDTATAIFSDVVQCDTLIANSVVASSYTPGAGNVQ